MAIRVIGAGVGRTGTYSLKLAINKLGLGPCHHMDEVLHQMQVQVPLWVTAAAGRPDWEAIYRDYECAVDWPTAGFFRQLYQAYPRAKFVLTHRDPEKWVDSFTATLYKLLAERHQAPPEIRPWLEMADVVVAMTGFPGGLDRDSLMLRFVAHNEAVKATIPASQLLIYEVTEGWGPLCDFLGVPVPPTPFPRTNAREKFWDGKLGKI